jgi:hypothetical protein
MITIVNRCANEPLGETLKLYIESEINLLLSMNPFFAEDLQCISQIILEDRELRNLGEVILGMYAESSHDIHMFINGLNKQEIFVHLLHEIGHGVAKKTGYKSGDKTELEKLKEERFADVYAAKLAKKYLVGFGLFNEKKRNYKKIFKQYDFNIFIMNEQIQETLMTPSPKRATL